MSVRHFGPDASMAMRYARSLPASAVAVHTDSDGMGLCRYVPRRHSNAAELLGASTGGGGGEYAPNGCPRALLQATLPGSCRQAGPGAPGRRSGQSLRASGMGYAGGGANGACGGGGGGFQELTSVMGLMMGRVCAASQRRRTASSSMPARSRDMLFWGCLRAGCCTSARFVEPETAQLSGKPGRQPRCG